jgi:hypothetical protein
VSVVREEIPTTGKIQAPTLLKVLSSRTWTTPSTKRTLCVALRLLEECKQLTKSTKALQTRTSSRVLPEPKTKSSSKTPMDLKEVASKAWPSLLTSFKTRDHPPRFTDLEELRAQTSPRKTIITHLCK